MTDNDSTVQGRQDSLPDKAQVLHLENALPNPDDAMTPWQCIARNPKIVMWTLYANSQFIHIGSFPCAY